jgi:hypothetical protein
VAPPLDGVQPSNHRGTVGFPATKNVFLWWEIFSLVSHLNTKPTLL